MFVIWLSGMSGSGKTTIGRKLICEIKKQHDNIEFIDGDEVREFFGQDLDYSHAGRIANNKRIIFAAKLLENHGIGVVIANIAPYEEIRQFARKSLKHYILVYVKASFATCEKRDVKGHYAKVKSGKMKNFTGHDDVYETPLNPEIVCDTEKETLDDCVKKIIEYLKERRLI